MYSTYQTNYLNPGNRANSYTELVTFGDNNSKILSQL